MVVQHFVPLHPSARAPTIRSHGRRATRTYGRSWRGFPGGSGPCWSPLPIDAAPPSIERVWPQAVHKLPSRLPNGRLFTPELFLDDHTVLAGTVKDGNADKLD